MSMVDNKQDAVIIGGGFYGAAVAIYLAKQRGLKRVLLLEYEQALLTRASYNNQARVHNGYHYPRSFTTAYRSRINLPNFVRDWPQAVQKNFTNLYAIARRNSKVTAKQFEHFCRKIDANIQPANSAQLALFESRLIENVYQVEEYVFDASILARLIEKELNESGVEVHFETRATEISNGLDSTLNVTVQTKHRKEDMIHCRYVFNCTYSGLNQFKGDFLRTQAGLKQEITEMALIQSPVELQDLGITVMDGPFFSMMPFPDKGMHTLSHVRYTPHIYWKDVIDIDPYQKLKQYDKTTRFDRMIRDVGRYLPVVFDAKYIDSLFEVKTILEKSEIDDSRPILFEKHQELPGCFSILGGKIDNIYDVIKKLEAEKF